MANQRPDDYLSATAAAHRLGVSIRTLRRYTQDGRLPDARGAGRRRIFRVGDLDAITSKPETGRAVAYARVSSRRQQADGDLDRQVARLLEHDNLTWRCSRTLPGVCLTGGRGLRKALRAVVAAGTRTSDAR
jgi:excisionase family DNA binding protein